MTNSGGLSPTDQTVSPRKRFVLAGHSAVLDPAVHAVRDDLADVDLADRVFAPHYAQAMRSTVLNATSVHLRPDAGTARVDALAVGVAVDVFDISAGWAWVRTGRAIGYIRADCVRPA